MLKRLTHRIFYLPHEEETDRPALYYIRGDRYSLAVDAGSSDAHRRKFYAALAAAGPDDRFRCDERKAPRRTRLGVDS